MVDILEYIRQMQEMYGEDVITTADKLEKPPKTVVREMFQNAFKNNKADGGRIGFDGGGSPLQRLRQEIVDSMRPYAPGYVTEDQLQLVVKDITLDMTAEQAQESAKANFIKLFGMAEGGRAGYNDGQLVTPSVDGLRPGYSGMPDNVKKTPYGTYYYLRGKGENKVYRGGFDTPEAASKWGQKEFVKKFALPKKFVSASELTALLDVGTGEGSGMRSPFFERGDRPNYLLKEARKILGSYQAGKSNFFKAPTKKQIEYLKKYSKAPLIQENLAKNVQIILDSKAIMNDLSGKNKGGAKLPEFNKVVQVFKNAGVNASDAQITNALQKAAYLLRGDTFQTDVKFNVDKNTGKFVLKELENLPFDNQYARGIYKHALNEIRAELGDTAGNLESFKRNLRKRLPDGFLQKHGLEINEIFSVRASFKNKSFPYAYFIDATDAELNKKALRSFHGALSNAQKNLNNKITDIRAGKAKYDEAVKIVEDFQKTRSKFKNTIETNYPGKNFNLADIVLGKESEVLKKNMKIPEDVYSKKLLDKWKNQGLDITGHAKKTGYVMTGADNPGVFTAQDLSRDPKIRKSFTANILNAFCEAGRIKQATGTNPDGLTCSMEEIQRGIQKETDKARKVSKDGRIPKKFGKLRALGSALFGVADPAIEFMFAAPFLVAGDIEGAKRQTIFGGYGFPDRDISKMSNKEAQRFLKHEKATKDWMNNYFIAEEKKQELKGLKPNTGAFELATNQLNRANENMANIADDYGTFGYSFVGKDTPLQGKVNLQKQIRGEVAQDFEKKIEKAGSTEFFKDSDPEMLDLNLRQLGGDPKQVTPITNLESYMANKGEPMAGNENFFFNVKPYVLRRAIEYGQPNLFDDYAAGAGVEAPGRKSLQDAYSEIPLEYASQLAALEKKQLEEGLLKKRIGEGFAGGGIAKLAGVSSGPPPESGPNSQGLQGLLNRVKKV